MKKLVTAVAVVVGLLALVAVGCTNKNLVGLSPEAGQEVISSCVTCHTDKDTLQETATTEEVAKSEATTGEG
jgi:cytochrome c553